LLDRYGLQRNVSFVKMTVTEENVPTFYKESARLASRQIVPNLKHRNGGKLDRGRTHKIVYWRGWVKSPVKQECIEVRMKKAGTGTTNSARHAK
jgi:hypothetical protein